MDSTIWFNGLLNPVHPKCQACIDIMRIFEQQCSDAFRTVREAIRIEGSFIYSNDGSQYSPIKTLNFVQDYILGKNHTYSSEQYLSDLYETFITDYVRLQKNSGKRIQEATIKQYRIIQKRIREFEDLYGVIRLKDLYFSSNSDISARFILWLEQSKYYKLSSLEKAKRQLNTFLNFIKKQQHIQEEFIKFSSNPVEQVIHSKIYLSEDECIRLHSLEGLTGLEEIVRKVFIIACWTGLRYSDFHQIGDIAKSEGETCIIRTRKTNQEAIIVKLDQIKEYLDYFKENPLPKIVTNTNNNFKFNAFLKSIFKKAGLNRKVMVHGSEQSLYEFASSHLGRATFINTLVKDAVPQEQVMAITGHRSHRVFQSYLRPSESDVRESSFERSNRPFLNSASFRHVDQVPIPWTTFIEQKAQLDALTTPLLTQNTTLPR